MLETIRVYALECLEASGERRRDQAPAREAVRRGRRRRSKIARRGDVDLAAARPRSRQLPRRSRRAVARETASRSSASLGLNVLDAAEAIFTRAHAGRKRRCGWPPACRPASGPSLGRVPHRSPRRLPRRWRGSSGSRGRRSRCRDADDTIGARGRSRVGLISGVQGDRDAVDTLYEQATAMFRRAWRPEGRERRGARPGESSRCSRGDYGRAGPLLEESSRARDARRRQGLASTLLELGILALHERRYAEAVPVFVESLETRLSRRGVRVNVPLSLRGLAAAAAIRRRPRAGGPDARGGRSDRGADRRSDGAVRTRSLRRGRRAYRRSSRRTRDRGSLGGRQGDDRVRRRRVCASNCGRADASRDVLCARTNPRGTVGTRPGSEPDADPDGRGAARPERARLGAHARRSALSTTTTVTCSAATGAV